MDVTKFDNQLSEANHFKVHKEMLPYIGENYESTGLLIIAESHFMPQSNPKQPEDDWYDKDVNCFKTDNNTNTREILSNIKKHRIFSTIEKALKCGEIENGLSKIAFYNFYQKPAKHKVSIRPTPKDKEVAICIFKHILSVLQPKMVIFVSSKAFGELKDRKWDTGMGAHKYREIEIPIHVVPHPTSPWWNRKNKQSNNFTGKEKFIFAVKGLHEKAVGYNSNCG